MKKPLYILIGSVLLVSGITTKTVAAATPADGDTKGVVNSLNVTVPNVLGMLGGKGRTAIENAGLKWAYAPQGIPVSDPNKNAVIARQTPAGGSSAVRGSTVTLTLYIFSQGCSDGDTKGTVNPLGR
ncbi:MAG: PASTA domain-containing protein [Chlorobiaceae bacterium]|nr:PASTA domain-containing protein [Chlorobiaceae bacterium]